MEYLSDKILIGSKVYVEDVQWQDVYVNLNLAVLDGLSTEKPPGAPPCGPEYTDQSEGF